jgi:hypothetical protein
MRKSPIQICTCSSVKGRSSSLYALFACGSHCRRVEKQKSSVDRCCAPEQRSRRITEAGRSRSRADFVSKIGVAVEEADETAFWLELLIEAELVSQERLAPLLAETNELLAIMSASRMTAKRNLQNR